MTLLEQHELNTMAGELYERDMKEPFGGRLPLRLIAFYLPQFHSIPENDEWWGTGFTEWTNVTKALPRFEGHYQPHLPDALGFYDLSHVDALRRQAQLAQRYGIYGFCFHYYWFHGKRLLERPLENLLRTPDIDLPFFLNWANESWSRRWDGRDHDVLMEQRHSAEDDIAFAEALEPIFRDPRYIRIDGRPMLGLYRPGILPDAAATIKRWREYFKSKDLPNPYIIMPRAFGDLDPRKYGMDAALGFPPHECLDPVSTPTVLRDLELLDKRYQGRAYRYEDVARKAISIEPQDFRFFPGVCPSWDNDARKPNKSACLVGATPLKYADWLRNACRYAMQAEKEDERIVFVNAWNEWAEGAHLEPDRHFGHAYLAATARVLEELNSGEAASISPKLQRSSKSKRTIASTVKKVRYKIADLLDNFATRMRP